MSEAQLSGEEMMAQNMAALDRGEDFPHTDDFVEESDGLEGEVVGDELEGEELEEQESEEQEDIHEEELEEESDARHMSKEDWVASGKDADSYLSPDEFKRAGDLKSESPLQLAKKLAKQESMMKEILANQHKANKLREDEDMAKLKADQAQAVEYGETEKALNIEREVAKREAIKPAEAVTAPDTAIQTFYDANKDWYGRSKSATEMLDVLMAREEQKGIGFAEAIGPVTAKVKAKFDYLFDDSEPEPKEPPAKKPLVRPRAISEKSRTPKKAATKNRTFKELDPSMQAVARQMAKSTDMTEHDYVSQILGA